MHEELGYIHLVTKEGWDQKRSRKKMKANQQKDYIRNKFPMKNSFFGKLKNNGLMLLEDITTKNEDLDEWLPKMMDGGLKALNCCIVSKNEGYNQIYTITHSHKQNDLSRVAWRMIKH